MNRNQDKINKKMYPKGYKHRLKVRTELIQNEQTNSHKVFIKNTRNKHKVDPKSKQKFEWIFCNTSLCMWRFWQILLKLSIFDWYTCMEGPFEISVVSNCKLDASCDVKREPSRHDADVFPKILLREKGGKWFWSSLIGTTQGSQWRTSWIYTGGLKWLKYLHPMQCC